MNLKSAFSDRLSMFDLTDCCFLFIIYTEKGRFDRIKRRQLEERGILK